MKNRFIISLLFFFVVLIMVDPTNRVFHLKEIVFVILLFSGIAFGKSSFPMGALKQIGILSLCVFISIATGIIIYNSHMVGTEAYLKSLLILFVVIPLTGIRTDILLKINYYAGLILSIIISLLYIGMILGNAFAVSYIDRLIEADDTILMARRVFLGYDTIMFFYKSMPFCFFALIYALRRNYVIQSSTILFSIILGGSRTPILAALTIIAYVIYNKNKSILKYLLASIAIYGLVILITQLISIENLNSGDTIKFTTATELLRKSDILGHGVGSVYWSSARSEFVSNSEMTYFEMLYHYGWLFTPLVLWLFYKPFKILFRKQNESDIKDFAIVYLLYLINAGTNPLLFNSTGLYVVACALFLSEYSINKKYIYDFHTPSNLQFKQVSERTT